MPPQNLPSAWQKKLFLQLNLLPPATTHIFKKIVCPPTCRREFGQSHSTDGFHCSGYSKTYIFATPCSCKQFLGGQVAQASAHFICPLGCPPTSHRENDHGMDFIALGIAKPISLQHAALAINFLSGQVTQPFCPLGLPTCPHTCPLDLPTCTCPVQAHGCKRPFFEWQHACMSQHTPPGTRNGGLGGRCPPRTYLQHGKKENLAIKLASSSHLPYFLLIFLPTHLQERICPIS